jgi:cytochrome c biogenesis protein CcmG/thiol:disulfide interchange protein DsbE
MRSEMPVSSMSLERRRWLRQALVLCAGAGLPALSAAARGNDLAVGKPAPPLVLNTLEGKSIASNALTGKVVILTFWATWCEPCREELPLLSAYAARHEKDGLQVLGFSLDGPENLPAVRKVAASLSFPVGLLPSPWAGGYGRIWRLPVNFTIDRAGLLVNNGWDDEQPAWTEARLERVVSALLRPAV